MIPMNTKSGIAMRVSRSTSQYRLRKLVTPALSHSTGPPCAKYAPVSPAKSQPQSAAIAMAAIAEPGSAKPTGKPDMRAPTMRTISRARKTSSMTGAASVQTAPTPRPALAESVAGGAASGVPSRRRTATLSRK